MKNKSFYRKITYLVIMSALLIPLYLLSGPSFLDADGQLSEGGLLTRQRAEYDLSQASLGEIDPTSEAMKLASLGFRGVAANLQWYYANEYKKKEQWDKLRATLNQVSKLQPNFIEVWKFQAWNLSYNVSVEFDNYKHRYLWVKKGMEFLMQGIRYNRNDPRLLGDMGWFFGHKIGRADEYRQFRREFRQDNDFHRQLQTSVPIDRIIGANGPDNWLTSHEWYGLAQNAVDHQNMLLRGKSPLIFHSDLPKTSIRYADAIEEEGILDEAARAAWSNAQNEWITYGNRSIPTSFGYPIRLYGGDLAEPPTTGIEELATQSEMELEELLPGVKTRLIEERIAKLPADEAAAVRKQKELRTAEEFQLALAAEPKIEVTPLEVAAQAPQESASVAKRLARTVMKQRAEARTTKNYRQQVNYEYWLTRCRAEMSVDAIRARKHLYDGDQKYKSSTVDLEGARAEYDAAWELWAKIHAKYPLLADDVASEDLIEPLKRYRTLLQRGFDEEFPPEDFPMLETLKSLADDLEMSKDQIDELIRRRDARRQTETLPASDTPPAETPPSVEPRSGDTPPAETSPSVEPPSGDTPQTETEPPSAETPTETPPTESSSTDTPPAEQ